MTIDPTQYRHVLGHFPTGVTVVTSADGDEPVGFTVGSFTSVSLAPPLVGFLAMQESDRWRQIRASGRFCVNVLAETHGELCWRFAKTTITEPFQSVAWHPSPETGSPVLDDAIAWMDCDIHAIVDAGDHHFVMGLVRALEHLPADADPRPLLFYRGTLGGFAGH